MQTHLPPAPVRPLFLPGLLLAPLLLAPQPLRPSELALAAPVGTATDEGRADLSGIFGDWEAWEEGLAALESAAARFAALRDEPIEDAEALLHILRARDEVYRRASRVEGYVRLKLDLDRGDEEAARRRQRTDAVTERWNAASGWWTPRLMELGRERVSAWLEQEPQLAPYRFSLERSFLSADHSLPPEQERLLDLADLFARQTERVYNALNVGQPPAAAAELIEGGHLEITPAGARRMLAELADPRDRRAAQRAWLEALGRREQAHAALLGGVVDRWRFVATARGFGSALEAALWGDQIPTAVVDRLLAVTREGTEPIRRYHRLRKQALGVERYGTADRFVALRPSGRRLTYAEARERILASTAPLGPEVQDVMRRAFEEGWIDAFERPGKRPLGGEISVYGAHPYVLVNFDGALDELFQLTHELGHAVHSELAERAQPFVNRHPSTLTGETIAAVSEILLVEHLLGTAATPEERVAYLDFAAQNAMRLFYRTVLDAGFELSLYNGEVAPTAGSLGDLYAERLGAAYGDAVALEPWDRRGWLAVPHFFTAPLYMLRYGLSYAAAAALVDDLTAPDPEQRRQARHRYLELLRAGGGDFPLALLRRAGADLEDPAVVASVPRRLEHWVEQLEIALAAGGEDR